MKKIILPFLCALTLGFTSCKKETSNIQSYQYVPAIVYQTYPSVLEIDGGKLSVPQLADESLMPGDLLMTTFTVDLDNQPTKEILTVSEFAYMTLGSTSAKPGPGEEDYSGSIKTMDTYPYSNGIVKNTLFLWFIHDVPKDQAFDYEMIFDPEETSETRTLYIRAKKSNVATETTNVNLLSCYGFDLTDFLSTVRNGTDKVKFFIQYKTGADESGNDIYKLYSTQPFSL